MQQRRGPAGNAVATSVVLFLILVVVFAVFDPFHGNGLWVYGMSAVATAFCVGKINSQPAKKPAPKKPPDLAAAFRAGEESAVPKKLPASVAPRVNPRLARAQRIWAMERELGIEPGSIFGYDPPASPPVITKRPEVSITLAEVAEPEPKKPEPLRKPTDAERLAELEAWANSPTPRQRREPGRDWGAVVRKSLREANARAPRSPEPRGRSALEPR